jgi:hypothetical protein
MVNTIKLARCEPILRVSVFIGIGRLLGVSSFHQEKSSG